jgi:carboxylesterase
MVVLDDSYHIVTVDRQRHLVVERTAAFIANVADCIGRAAAPARAAA